MITVVGCPANGVSLGKRDIENKGSDAKNIGTYHIDRDLLAGLVTLCLKHLSPERTVALLPGYLTSKLTKHQEIACSLLRHKICLIFYSV